MLAGGILVVALVSVGFYLGLRALITDNGDVVLETIWDIYDYELPVTRVIVGLLSLLFWPGALWLALIIMKVSDRVPPALVNLSGLFLSALCFVCSWLPPSTIILGFFIPVVISLVIVLTLYRLAVSTALAVWGLHIVMVTLALMVCALVLERIDTGRFYNPFTEIPAVLKYHDAQGGMPNPGIVEVPISELPLDTGIRWVSTGSDWLDRRAG